MSEHWSSQAVDKKLNWFARIWQTESSKRQLPARKSQLDAALLDTSLAFKHDRTTTVTCIAMGQEKVVLKRYNPRTLGHAFSRSMRRTRARRSWNMSYAFDRAGLNVAAPILMYEQRFGPIRFDAYFASELLHGEELLKVLPAMQPEQQLEVAREVASAFEKMRVAKLTHGDMKATNLIWNHGKLFFIDLDAAQKHRNRVTWNAGHQKDRRRFKKNWHGYQDLMDLFVDL